MTLGRNWLIAAALLAAPLTALHAVPTKPGDPAQAGTDDARLEEALRALREAMLPAGERVEGWDVGGADPSRDVRALGADEYYLLEDDSDGTRTLTILTGRPIAELAPSAWRVAESYGSAGVPMDNPSTTFGYLSPRYVLAGRGDVRRARDADCTDGIGHAILYEVPGAPSGPEDGEMLDFFRAAMLAFEGQTVCSRYDGDRDKGYSGSLYFPDGRRVLNPDRTISKSRVAIVPAAPIDSLIKFTPPAEPKPQP